MGIYVIGTEEFKPEFEAFLLEQEGDVPAETVAEAWNELVKENKWDDELQAINKFSKKPIKEPEIEVILNKGEVEDVLIDGKKVHHFIISEK